MTIKYVMVLLRIDNKGEGGTFTLMSLGQSVAKRRAPIILGLGIAGAASFFVSRRVLRPTSKSEMPRWQEMLFIALTARS